MPSGLVTKEDHLKKVFNFIFRLRSCSKVFFVTKHLKCVLGDYQFKIKYQISDYFVILNVLLKNMIKTHNYKYFN